MTHIKVGGPQGGALLRLYVKSFENIGNILCISP